MSQFNKFYFSSSILSTFRTLIHPSSGACDFSLLYHHLINCDIKLVSYSSDIRQLYHCITVSMVRVPWSDDVGMAHSKLGNIAAFTFLYSGYNQFVQIRNIFSCPFYLNKSYLYSLTPKTWVTKNSIVENLNRTYDVANSLPLDSRNVQASSAVTTVSGHFFLFVLLWCVSRFSAASAQCLYNDNVRETKRISCHYIINFQTILHFS